MSNRVWLLAAALVVARAAPPARAQFVGGGPASPPAYYQGRLAGHTLFYFGTAPPMLGFPYGYGWSAMPGYGGFGLPPPVAPADVYFGPPALALPDVADEDDAPARPKVRVANAEATARARQFIDYGDARFHRQEFSEAYQRYRKAAEAAPDLADAYFREGFAQSALGRYLPAVKSIRRGLALKTDWATSEFNLSHLYHGNRAAKELHFEQLATAADKQPESAELMFLLGVELFFDGQPVRAHTFLHRAADLGFDAELLRGFLDAAARQKHRRPRGEEL